MEMLEEARTRLPSETDDSEISAFSDNLISWERTLGAILNEAASYTQLRSHETVLDLVCRVLLEKKKHTDQNRQEEESDTVIRKTNTRDSRE